MPIKFVRHNATQADNLLAVVESLCRNLSRANTADLTIIVAPYQNGRERGHFLVETYTQRAVAFSEYRNTDQIVIYTGMASDFDATNGNTPSEEVYTKKIFQGCGKFNSSATIVYNFLTKGITP